ncbi:PKD domain-containing protein [Aestuariivirga litoralis]|uniref:PKD domain-containing protein n=1 Tax=Aestuariivirga litoralis TaxID=2650924 RepID=A0A2W2ASU8_9HYPH|nr:PKD domain-containing protein [Aestuariivirga litoralis]PZF75600.1 PKD domain-containing protein [Aestuariivirga litoralis]
MTVFSNSLKAALLISAAAMTAPAQPALAEAKLQFPPQETFRVAFPAIDLGARQSRGQDAVNRLGPHLPDVAQWYGRSAEALRKELLSDTRMRVDQGGRLLFVEDLAEPVRDMKLTGLGNQSIRDGALASLDQTFYLHSRPGANRTIYLDFDGASIAGTAWNSNGNTITAAPFDLDGNPAAFSAAELERVQYIWQRVAEDYAPFDVDVTTAQPTQDRLTRSDANDQVFGTTVVITRRTGVYSCSCGGIAYVGVFNASGGSRPPDYYKPAFVFFDMLGSGNEKAVAEAVSHEAGHNMGLHHDGTTGDAYYAGQGNDPVTGWAPIMGVGYYRPLVQFSKGEYAGANNKEDDFAISQSFGLPLRLDDYGSSTAAATPFVHSIAAGRVSGSMDGVIETASDADVFAIAAGTGTLTASVQPANRSPDLDVALSLLDSTGKVVATSNPQGALNAPLSFTVTQQGTYYLAVKGTGEGAATATGYSNYGSVGNFRLSANYAAPTGMPPVAVISATPTSGPSPLAVTLDGRPSTDDGRVAFWYWDFGDGSRDVTGALSSTSHVYRVAGSYVARLTVVDDTGLSASTTRVINATIPGPQANVQSILISTKTNTKNYAWAVAAVTVVDQTGHPLRSAKVAANWNGITSKTQLATTNSSGRVTLTSPKTLASGCFNIYIDAVTIPAYPFNGASLRSAQVCR